MDKVKKYSKIAMKVILSLAFFIGTIPLTVLWFMGSFMIMINTDYNMEEDATKWDKIKYWWLDEHIKDKMLYILFFGYLLIKDK